jgi:hypothetical protein
MQKSRQLLAMVRQKLASGLNGGSRQPVGDRRAPRLVGKVPHEMRADQDDASKPLLLREGWLIVFTSWRWFSHS